MPARHAPLICVLLFVGSASAQQKPVADLDVCGLAEQLGESVMTGRQAGIMMSTNVKQAMELPEVIALPGEEARSTLRGLVEDMAIDAYGKPRLPERLQRDEIVEFASRQYSNCLRATRKK